MTGISNGLIAFIGIGSNLDDPALQCEVALGHINTIDGCRLQRCSSFYQTEPVGFPDQAWFINAVAEVRAEIGIFELFRQLQEIEIKMGRQRLVKWGPRIIDLDLLFYGQQIIAEANLTVPHPEVHKRRFVLEPLHEIAPYMIHPGYGISIAGLMKRLDDNNQVKRIEKVS